MKILLPISLDRWKNPISTLLRACVQYNPGIEFHSFSNPQSQEDRVLGEEFWKLPNLRLRNPSAILFDRFDIVHTASYSHGNYISSVLAKLRGMGKTKFLDTMNLEQHPSHPICWARYRRVLRWVDSFVAVSEAVADDIRNRVPDRFSGVIPNGFDPSLYDPKLSISDEVPDKIKHLPSGYPLWVAAIDPRKHPEIFITLAKKNPNIPFVALGSPIGEQGYKYSLEFEKTPNIYWLGNVERKVAKAVLARAGVLVFPSEREGLSLAMIEAVAMCVPIIAQPKSSMPELVFTGINGDLVDEKDIEGWNAMTNKWLKKRSDNTVNNLFNMREQAIRKYNWRTVGESYGPIYRRVHESEAKMCYPVS